MDEHVALMWLMGNRSLYNRVYQTDRQTDKLSDFLGGHKLALYLLSCSSYIYYWTRESLHRGGALNAQTDLFSGVNYARIRSKVGEHRHKTVSKNKLSETKCFKSTDICK
jgi:hypothetical protein